MNQVLLELLRQYVKKVVKNYELKVIKNWAKSAKPDIQFNSFANEFDVYIVNPGAPKPHPRAKKQDWTIKVEGEKFEVWVHAKKRSRK